MSGADYNSNLAAQVTNDLTDWPDAPAQTGSLTLDPLTGLLSWSGAMPSFEDMLAADVGDVPVLNAQKTGFQMAANSGVGTVFAMDADWVNPKSYGAAGVVTQTTLSSSAVAGNNYIEVVDASSYAADHGIVIPGAGSGGVNLSTTVLSVSVNRINLATTIVMTVISGATVHHDDTLSIKLAVATDKHVYAELGDYNIHGGDSPTSILIGDISSNQKFFGAGTASTIITNRSADISEAISLAGHSVQLKEMMIRQDSSVTATAGCLVYVGDSRLTPSEGSGIQKTEVETIQLNNGYNNIVFGNMTKGWFNKVGSSGAENYCVLVDAPNPRGGNSYSNFIINSSNANTQALLKFEACDNAIWSDIQFGGNKSITYIHVKPRVGQRCSGQMFSTTMCDGSGPTDFTFFKFEEGDAGEAVADFQFHNTYFNNSNTRTLVDVGQNCEDIKFYGIDTSDASNSGTVTIDGISCAIHGFYNRKTGTVVTVGPNAIGTMFSNFDFPRSTVYLDVHASSGKVLLNGGIVGGSKIDPGGNVTENGVIAA